jgi:hypothetical protein
MDIVSLLPEKKALSTPLVSPPSIDFTFAHNSNYNTQDQAAGRTQRRCGETATSYLPATTELIRQPRYLKAMPPIRERAEATPPPKLKLWVFTRDR